MSVQQYNGTYVCVRMFTQQPTCVHINFALGQAATDTSAYASHEKCSNYNRNMCFPPFFLSLSLVEIEVQGWLIGHAETIVIKYAHRHRLMRTPGQRNVKYGKRICACVISPGQSFLPQERAMFCSGILAFVIGYGKGNIYFKNAL